MKLVKKTLSVCALLLAFNITAQTFDNSGNISSGTQFAIDSENGHPFLMNDWYEGTLVKNDGTLTDKMFINYQVVEGFLTFMKMEGDKKTFLKISDADYKGFMLKDANNQMYLYTKIKGTDFDKEKNENRFYQIIDPPTNAIIVETTKTFDDPNAGGWGSTTTTTKRGSYKSSSNTYVLNKDGKYEKVKLNNRGIERVYSDKKSEIRAFMKQRKIDVKEAKDLILVVKYYTSLHKK